ncbi:hypothetical protein OPT61_g5399 [Boeremia exigua]|uniref:Uncharacterized protein n=1 Tax=Boeremia exigua TaxID=749465 RepID=A0ACC2IAI8_9PLEO|nr:hypothetical protein OPT61_g5399 [Boeremia exigua]
MKSCTWSSLDSPGEAPRLSFHNHDGLTYTPLAPRRLVRKPSKLQTTMEVTRCRFGNTSRQAAPIGCEDLYPQKDWIPIFHAVYHDREAALRHYLHAGVSPNAMEGPDIPLLCIAAACGHSGVVEILLEAGADVNLASAEKGETAMHVAIRMGRHDVVDLLLVYRVDLQSKTNDSGQTALHYAAAVPSSIKLVTKLLAHGADYEVRDSKGQTPAVVALHAHNVHAAMAIINMARGKSNQLLKEKTMLMRYVEGKTTRIHVPIDLIVDVFTATCDPGSTILIEAIKKNDTRLVETFLEKGANPQEANGNGLLPIIVAAKFASLRIIKLLVQHGADVTVRGPGRLDVLQVLFKTFTTRDEDSVVSIVEYLLAKGADGLALYSDGKTLLHRAVSADVDYAKVVKLLIKSGVEHSTQDKDGNTALHLAASNGLVNATNVLLDSHADTMTVDAKKRTALLRAVLKQHWLVVSLLAFSPAITSWDAEGSTALHHIAQSIPNGQCSWKDIATAAKPFCERGISRSMRNRSGATPLVQAIKSLPEEGLPVIESLLLEGDRRWNCIGHEDHKSRDALYYAAIMGKPVFVQVLLENGAPLVLEDWTDVQRQLALPTTLKHRILDLIVECGQSRSKNAIKEEHKNLSGTRIEIVRSELRTSSALSGYHADCEMPRRLKAIRNGSKRSPPTQRLWPQTQEKSNICSKVLSTRTAGIQIQPREPIQYHDPVHRIQMAVCPSAASIQTPIIPVCTRTVRFTREVEHTEIASRISPARSVREANATFPTRTSSRQQTVTRSTVGTSRHTPIVLTHEITSSKKAMKGNATLEVEESRVSAKLNLHVRGAQAIPQSFKAPAESMPAQGDHSDYTKLSVSGSDTETATTTLQKATSPVPTLANVSTLDQQPPVTSLPATKPVQPTRIDSGMGLRQERGEIKPLSALERCHSPIDGTLLKMKRRSGDELASWLAISNMIDRL